MQACPTPQDRTSIRDRKRPGMNLLTFRNFINFCLGFGWTTVLLRNQIASNVLLMASDFWSASPS